ncbi:MAG: SigB/SigF/SigG family RNA polymerase sigma factor [Actinomycetota bacterium]|nr:SigB/SigF/SigG family RNA polymerase sigma factor [Actinomycetota bacterium]
MEEIVRRFMSFARSLALRYRGGTEQIEDLVQVANLGLVQAIERFDPDRGAAFKSFAAPTILGELKRHFRDRVWNLRLPRGLQERILRLEGAATELTSKLKRPPTVHELAEELGMDDIEILEAFEAAQTRRTLSFDQPVTVVGTADESTVGEQLGTEDPHYEGVEDRAAVEASMPGLTEREVLALRLRFVEELTQSEIAERIGCSQVHVSRILRGALQRLRENADPDGELPG